MLGSALSEQVLHRFVRGHLSRMLLLRHGGLLVNDTTKAHNAAVNRDRQDMNLVKLIERYGDDDRCRTFLEQLRWPDGVRCPRCGFAKVSHVRAKNREGKERNQYDCNSCRYQFWVTSGTVFPDIQTPLSKWF